MNSELLQLTQTLLRSSALNIFSCALFTPSLKVKRYMSLPKEKI